MEEAIVMKIIIGLTIITILGFIYLRRENKELVKGLTEAQHIVKYMERQLGENAYKLSQQEGLIEEIRHRVDAHEVRLFT